MINILIILVVITYIVFFTFGFISYAFNSYGLYEIAKKEDEKNESKTKKVYSSGPHYPMLAYDYKKRRSILSFLAMFSLN